ncbi:MAG: hypothetical protein WAS21_09650, partial [Geminicoccaceae bacterium]
PHPVAPTTFYTGRVNGPLPPPASGCLSPARHLGARSTPKLYLHLVTPVTVRPIRPWLEQRLARRLREIYARELQADINRITVAIRELGEGGA